MQAPYRELSVLGKGVNEAPFFNIQFSMVLAIYISTISFKFAVKQECNSVFTEII